jgi:hypothetical protein
LVGLEGWVRAPAQIEALAEASSAEGQEPVKDEP